MIVADGLMAFLAPQEMISLLDRLISHFPSGEVAFNGYTRFAIWAARHYHGTQSVASLYQISGFDDPREPESWNPRLKLVREILLTREPEVAGFPRFSGCLPVWPHAAPPYPGGEPRCAVVQDDDVVAGSRH